MWSEYCVWLYVYHLTVVYDSVHLLHGVSTFDWGTLYNNIVYMIAREQYTGLWQKVGQHSLAFCITPQSLIKSRSSFTIYIYVLKKSLRLKHYGLITGFRFYIFYALCICYYYIYIHSYRERYVVVFTPPTTTATSVHGESSIITL